MSANQTIAVPTIISTATHFKSVTPKGEKGVEVFPEYDISNLETQTVKDLIGAQLDIIFCRVMNRIKSKEEILSWNGTTQKVDAVWLLANESSKASPEVQLQQAFAKKGIILSIDQVNKMLSGGAEALTQAFGL